jgi:hypothetical protein
MQSVTEFGRAITKPLGAPTRKMQTYIEVPFELAGVNHRPDGCICVKRGDKTWTALVEVKTKDNPLSGSQIEGYLDVARDQGFDAVLTISNEIPPVWGSRGRRFESFQPDQGRGHPHHPTSTRLAARTRDT